MKVTSQAKNAERQLKLNAALEQILIINLGGFLYLEQQLFLCVSFLPSESS
jgi:hypothetical protein